jgi:outer membrane usher protein
VNDAFAVVDTGGLQGVRVMRENRIIGETDAAGRIFIPDLHAFEINHLAIDPNDVPPDITLSSATHEIRPQDRTGVVVPFQIRRIPSALLRLVDEDDHPIPVGSAATLRSTGTVLPVGYDGLVYVEGVAEHDELNIEEPDGKRCIAAFTHHDLPGEIPELGPIPCQERSP